MNPALCAGGVSEASDDGRTVDVPQSRSVQSVAAQHSQGVVCLCARRHESLDVLTDRKIISNYYAQHLQAAAARDSWQWWRFINMPSPPPTVGKKNFARLVTVKIEIIPIITVLCNNLELFNTVVRWRELDEVENERTSHNLGLIAIFLPKIIKIGGNLTKFWQNQFCKAQFFRHGVFFLFTSSSQLGDCTGFAVRSLCTMRGTCHCTMGWECNRPEEFQCS